MSNNDRLQRVVSYGASLLGNLESMDAADSVVGNAAAWAATRTGKPLSDPQKDATRAAYLNLVGNSLTPADLNPLEAIIFPSLRPVGDVRGGAFTLPAVGEFAELVSSPEISARLTRALQSVGCVVLPGHPSMPYGGTGVVVGKGLVMTNRHVAQIFSTGLGTKGIRFATQLGAGIDPLREETDRADPVYSVTRVVMVHPYWDMALLEVPTLPNPPIAVEPLKLGCGDRRKIAVIGYPAMDPRNPSDVQMDVFQGRFYVKRLAPGYVTGYDKLQSFENEVDAMLHDASTLGGNSGSAIVDVMTGNVIAIHFAGRYQQTNYAVPVAELARDGRVIDAGVKFTKSERDANLPWEGRWKEVEPTASEAVLVSRPSPAPVQAPAPIAAAPGQLRVTIPIEVTVKVGQAITTVAASAPAPLVAQPAASLANGAANHG